MLITAISVFAVVVSMIGGSYALFSSTSKADEYNVLKVGELEISYVDTGDGYGDVLSLSGAYPISDTEGINSTPYRFSITNTGSITADFKIKILYDESIIEEDKCQDNLLDQKYVKYRFDNNEPVLLSDKESEDYVIYEANGLLPAKSSEIHEIRIWITENAPNEVLGKHFHGKVVIESTQSGIEDTYKIEYKVGDSVTLKDNSHWHVLEQSNNTSTTITLLSDYNLNTDGTYNITCDTNICSPQAFDVENHRLTETNSYCTSPLNGCNRYEQNGSTVTIDSSAKIFLDTVYLPKLKEALTTAGGTLDNLTVTMPTMEQLAIADEKTFDQKQVNFDSSWISTTNYWTKTPSNLDESTSYVWYVIADNNNSYIQNANNNSQFGIRPVIITTKNNIKK